MSYSPEIERLILMFKDPACVSRGEVMKKICDACSRERSDYLLTRILCELSYSEFPEIVPPVCNMLTRVKLDKRHYSRVRRVFDHWQESMPGSKAVVKNAMDDLMKRYPDFGTETLWK